MKFKKKAFVWDTLSGHELHWHNATLLHCLFSRSPHCYISRLLDDSSRIVESRNPSWSGDDVGAAAVGWRVGMSRPPTELSTSAHGHRCCLCPAQSNQQGAIRIPNPSHTSPIWLPLPMWTISVALLHHIEVEANPTNKGLFVYLTPPTPQPIWLPLPIRRCIK